MSKKPCIIYYSNELEDEFAEDNIIPKRIDGCYQYIREGIWSKVSHVFWYRIIAIPLAKLYMKLYFHHRIINKEILKQAGKQGYFLYGNHTHFLADALIPTMVNMPRMVSVIVHPNNVSMPILGRITPSLGALPLPGDADAAKNFVKAITAKIMKKECVMIYPEAHIWPYYTDIRPFKDTSFRYPIQYKVPSFCLTNTYQKRRFSKKPRIVTYLDGPFYPDEKKSAKEQKSALRDVIYDTMKKRAQYNEVFLVRYEKVQKRGLTGRND